MSETSLSAIRFVNFLVKESHLILNDHTGNFNIAVDFTPQGYVLKQLNQFHLELTVKVTEATNQFDVQVKSIAIFEFDQNANIDELKNGMFTINAPAIVFPYIRAYIANLTAQSGLVTVTLPTLNLTALGEKLKSSIQEIG